jgi:hypothetical protein
MLQIKRKPCLGQQMSGKREISKTLHLKLSLLYDYVYVHFMSMIHDHRLYFAYTCDYMAIALCCIN